MSKSSTFIIPFAGLNDGRHHFSFSIDSTFFEGFEYSNFNKAQFEINLVLEKKLTMLNLHFKAGGFVNIPCDVTMEYFDLEVSPEFDLLVKFGGGTAENDEVLMLPSGSSQIDVTQYIYEMIVLAVPLKNVHPGVADGTLKSEIIDKLKELEPRKVPYTEGNDPRWDNLKKLIQE